MPLARAWGTWIASTVAQRAAVAIGLSSPRYRVRQKADAMRLLTPSLTEVDRVATLLGLRPTI